MFWIKPPLPYFGERLMGWNVDEDLGQPLSDDWDPRVFLKGLKVGCVHPDDSTYMKGEDLVIEARKRLTGRVGLSQHELAWFSRHWTDERIPKSFRDSVESGKTVLVATETVMQYPNGDRYVLYLFSHNNQILWHFYPLDSDRWHNKFQVLVPDDSSD